MKHFILSCLLAAFLLSACNSNKSKEPATTDESGKDKSSTEVTSDNTGQNTADDIQKKMEEMKKLPALTTDQIKALLPEELGGMKRSSFSANSMMGYGVGEAKYKSDDGKEMRLMVYDCVGEAGVGWYSMMYWGMNMESQDENGYTKTTTFNGGKAIEKYEKNQEQYSLMFPASNRLLINIEGEKTGLDAVKQAAGSLNLKIN
jgi:hypothetical protein